MDLHLKRLGVRGATLHEAQIVSRPAMTKTEEERRLILQGFHLPMKLSKSVDVQALRCEIQRASAAFGQGAGVKGGNPTKRMLLRFTWPGAERKSAGEIEDLLAGSISAPPP
ncbi:hypothetical protein [Neomegalonema perideroedes]|uniref:hypothetical protein n=1 Tax=Neomegalonema perideroedes TaxID=217219 RepID=UPI000360641D|nr:hypothetical protein [Neomegalonema perideroedes]